MISIVLERISESGCHWDSKHREIGHQDDVKVVGVEGADSNSALVGNGWDVS